MKIAKVVLCCVFMTVFGAALAQTSDVPRDHWAYDAVEELADKGYVLGYPDGSFLGDRVLTRYEFATVIKRVVDNLEERVAEVEAEVGKAPGVQPAPATGPTPAPPSPRNGEPGISREDLQQLTELIDEFKVELTVIGTRYDSLKALVDDMQMRLETVEAIVTDEEGALESTRSDVSKLKKIKLSGYVQARFDDAENKEDSTSDVKSSFLVRRARIKVTAQPTDKAMGVLQLELAKNKVGVKDAYLGYALGESFAASLNFYVGQLNWPFGYEVPYSSSKRETPERALVFRRLFPGERDQGAKLTAPVENPLYWQVGVFNGTGIEDGSSSDKNNHKDIIVDVTRGLSDNLDLGISGYWGEGVWAPDHDGFLSNVNKVRYGANAQYYGNDWTLKAEYVRGRGVDEAVETWDQSEYVDGYYTQLNYNVNERDTLVARYSALSEDPLVPALGRRTSWDLGWIRWLDSNTRMKLFYKVNEEETNEFDNDGFIAEWIVKY